VFILLAPFLFPETARFVPIPREWEHIVAPARLGLWEWTDYHFVFPGASALRVDGASVCKLAPHIWRVRWENRVGAARIVPDVGEAMPVEILSPLFPTLESHVHFFAALWRELAARFPPLLWSHANGTRRGASIERASPTQGEALEWLELWGESLESLGRAIERKPSLHLGADEWDAPLSQVRRVEGPQLRQIAARGAGVRSLPPHLRQTRWDESASPLRARLGQFVFRVSSALGEGDDARVWKRRLAPWSNPHSAHATFVARDALSVQLLELEASWGASGTPLWGEISRAARMRDIATLWEWWVLLALVRELESAMGKQAVWSDAFDNELGLRAPATIRLGNLTLVFNGATPSYSTPLRPDYVLRGADGKPLVALDAKFRLNVERGGVVGDDLHKMHAYRDALGVRVALALHPGDKSVFYDCERGPLSHWNLRGALNSGLSGVGAWGLRPQ